MTKSIDIRNLETQLAEILSRVERGEKFIISDRGVPIAKLVPYTSPEVKSDRIPGRLAGQIHVSDDFK